VFYLPQRAAAALRPRALADAQASHHALGLIGAALSEKIRVFQSGSLKMVPISPNAS
jgi:hypothetical protein